MLKLANSGDPSDLSGFEFDSAANRVRCLAQDPIDHLEQLDSLLQYANWYAEFKSASRRSIRALVALRLIPELHEILAKHKFMIEASVPLTQALFGYSFVYFGRNDTERHSSPEMFLQERETLREALKAPVKTFEAAFENARASNFKVERIYRDSSPADIERIALMHKATATTQTTGFDLAHSVLANKLKHTKKHAVYGARSEADGQIHATVSSSEEEIRLLDGRIFRFREISKSAQLQSAPSGLNALIKFLMIRDAAFDNIDLVFCESNASLDSINRINHSIGMNYNGFLPQHDDLGDRNVWTLHKDRIQLIGENVAASNFILKARVLFLKPNHKNAK